MKTIFNNKLMMFILIVVGIISSTVSILFEYVINYEMTILTYIIIIIDILLLLINNLYLSYLLTNNIWKAILNSIMLSILYLTTISGVVLMMAEEKSSFELMIQTLKILIYVGPNIIILLPIIWFLSQCLG